MRLVSESCNKRSVRRFDVDNCDVVPFNVDRRQTSPWINPSRHSIFFPPLRNRRICARRCTSPELLTIDRCSPVVLAAVIVLDSHVPRTDLKTAAMTNLNGVVTPPTTPSPNLLQMNMAREREKYLEEHNFPFCEAATKFEKLAKIGQGTFGYVQYCPILIILLSRVYKNVCQRPLF